MCLIGYTIKIVNEFVKMENSYEIKFDTVKIRTNINYFKKELITFNSYHNHRTGKLIKKSYNSKIDNSIPYNIYIGVNYINNSLTIEFSSKILLNDYPKLITKDTVLQCLENLNQLGICEIDVEAIHKDCFFAEIHTTKDVQMELTDNTLNELNTIVNNYFRFNWKHYEYSGIIFNKDVESKDCKESIKIYNKYKEITHTKNRKFLNLLSKPNDICNYFDGITRFETVFDTPEKIKNALGIPDTHINNIFNPTKNAILEQFNKVFGDGTIKNQVPAGNTADDFLIKSTLLWYNHDLKTIKQILRQCYSAKSRRCLSNKIKRIQQVSFDMQNNNKKSTVFSDIRNLLNN